VRAEHAGELADLMLDPRVFPWLWGRSEPPTLQELAAGAERAQAHWERWGFGLWLLRDRRTGEVVGRGGLQWARPRELPYVEVAWAIVPERWGQGLATELARASVRVGFDQLELDEIIALTLTHNQASRRVMEKTGFSYERDLTLESLPHALYRLRR
jgi:ribosomal-protein-alanine N-acetyltransferase